MQKRNITIALVAMLIFILVVIVSKRTGNDEVNLNLHDIDSIYKSESEELKLSKVNIIFDISGSMRNFVLENSNNKNTNYYKAIKILETDLKARLSNSIKILNFGNSISPAENNSTEIMDYANPTQVSSIYTKKATRMDILFDWIRVDNKKNSINIIITDGEAEKEGDQREKALLGDQIISLVKLLDEGLTLKIIGAKSNYKEYSKPFYLFIIGSESNCKEFDFFDSQSGFESIVLNRNILVHNDFDILFNEYESKNLTFIDNENNLIHVKTKNPGKISPHFTLSYTNINPIFSVSDNVVLSIENYSLNVNRDSSDYLATDIIDIKTVNFKYEKIDTNKYYISFDLMPWVSKSGTDVSKFSLYLHKDCLSLNKNNWISAWSTTNKEDFSKTYYLGDLINSIIKENLIANYKFTIAEFYLEIKK